MKRKITFFASLLLMLGMAVVPNTGSAQKDCSGGGCENRYIKCVEARVRNNPGEFDFAVCDAEFLNCKESCELRGRKP